MTLRALLILSLIVAAVSFYATLCSGQCSEDRGDVKTATDRSLFIRVPIFVTLGDLSRLSMHTVRHNTPREPREQQEYTVKATLVGYKAESDGDFHLVIQDSGRTMIIEAVNPGCAKSSPLFSQIETVRTVITGAMNPTATYRHCKIPIMVTGLLFEDFGHGQTGVADNFLELHPLVSIGF